MSATCAAIGPRLGPFDRIPEAPFEIDHVHRKSPDRSGSTTCLSVVGCCLWARFRRSRLLSLIQLECEHDNGTKGMVRENPQVNMRGKVGAVDASSPQTSRLVSMLNTYHRLGMRMAPGGFWQDRRGELLKSGKPRNRKKRAVDGALSAIGWPRLSSSQLAFANHSGSAFRFPRRFHPRGWSGLSSSSSSRRP